jgi:DNA-directed RNA polymerase alpha subunit
MHFLNLIKKDTNAITFDIRDVDTSLVNSIRRTILTDIPSVGFYFKLKDHFVENDINITANDSPLHNEFLAHRLSLIPLHFTKDEIENWKDTDYSFVLKKTNKTGQMINVTTGDFEIINSKNNQKMPETFTNRIFPKNKITEDHILLTKLKPHIDDLEKGNEIMIYATARKGVAKDCICWSIVSQCSYFNSLDEAFISKFLKEKAKNMSKDEYSEFKEEFDTLDKYRYFMKDKNGEPKQFTFSLEVETALTPYEVFHMGCTVLITQIENIIVELSKSDDSTVVDINILTDVPNFFTVMFKGYTHTIGNLVQSFMLNHYIRDKELKNEYELSYVGYSVPHPLEEMFLLKLKFDNDISKRQLYEFMIKCMTSIKSEIFDLSKEWLDFTK